MKKEPRVKSVEVGFTYLVPVYVMVNGKLTMSTSTETTSEKMYISGVPREEKMRRSFLRLIENVCDAIDDILENENPD